MGCHHHTPQKARLPTTRGQKIDSAPERLFTKAYEPPSPHSGHDRASHSIARTKTQGMQLRRPRRHGIVGAIAKNTCCHYPLEKHATLYSRGGHSDSAISSFGRGTGRNCPTALKKNTAQPHNTWRHTQRQSSVQTRTTRQETLMLHRGCSQNSQAHRRTASNTNTAHCPTKANKATSHTMGCSRSPLAPIRIQHQPRTKHSVQPNSAQGGGLSLAHGVRRKHDSASNQAQL